MEEINTINQALDIIKDNTYFIIFILMIIEGPLITAASAFAASLGYFNIYLIFALSFFGCFIPDLIYFSIGKRGCKTTINKLKQKYGEKKINKLIRKFHKNKKKTLVAVKLTPFASIPGIILSGLMGIKYKSFILISILTTIAISSVFLLGGYYFGLMFNALIKYFNIAVGIIVSGIIISIVYPLMKKKFHEVKNMFNRF